MGAACAVGVDTDPVAITATKFNASLNGLSVSDFNGYVVDPHGKVEGGVAPLEVFDLVVANILLNPLIDLAEIISGTVKVGGLVGLSGILVEQVRKEEMTCVRSWADHKLFWMMCIGTMLYFLHNCVSTFK